MNIIPIIFSSLIKNFANLYYKLLAHNKINEHYIEGKIV